MTTPTRTRRKPRILVLEGLSDASSCIRQAGGVPVEVSPRDMEGVDEALAAKFDGLLLTGGGDVDPRLYGEKPHKQTYGVSETRDYTEWMALDRAAELGVPVFGICRGMQLMAVHNGGRLKQHVHGHRGTDHLVFAEEGTLFAKALGRPKRGMFISLHHQVVLRHGDGWRVCGRAPNGSIEAIESRDGRCLGVQFHPEYDFNRNEQSRKLFDWLVRAAAKNAGLARPRRAPKPVHVQPRKPQRSKRGVAPVITRWACGPCGVEFDKRQDRDDHMAWIHGDPQLALDELLIAELPEDHPEWVPGADPGGRWY
jgi:putative glutamine amidotransferase